MTNTKTRFFYHYHRHGQYKMTVHFKGKCRQVNQVECLVPCASKFNKIQPLLVMQGYANKVVVKKGRIAVIS